MIGDARQLFDDGLLIGNFGIENAQRVGFDAALGIFFELIFYFSQLFAQKLDVLRTAVLVAYKVDVGGGARQADAIEKYEQHFENFGVDSGGIGLTEDFGADLVELAVAPFLWALAAEHWADVIKLLIAGESLHVVFDVGAADGGGGFGTKAHKFAPSSFVVSLLFF